jgi:hypothetical protein
MLPSFLFFIKQLVNLGRFNRSDFSTKLYWELVTALGLLQYGQVLMVEGLVTFAKAHPGYLVIDDTSNPKYGLKHLCQQLYDPKTGARRKGYKVVLFLWMVEGMGRIPIGFGLYDQTSGTCADLALLGFSLLRNHYGLKPIAVLADGAYATDEILKRLDDYRWALVMRCKKNRQLSGQGVRQCIPRGYGQAQGYLNNGVKVKVVRQHSHFLLCNRMLLEKATIRRYYALRWKIEEVFRAVKTLFGLDGCHQHSMLAQGIYVALCLVLFTGLELVSGGKPYQAWNQVNSGSLDLRNLMPDMLFQTF